MSELPSKPEGAPQAQDPSKEQEEKDPSAFSVVAADAGGLAPPPVQHLLPSSFSAGQGSLPDLAALEQMIQSNSSALGADGFNLALQRAYQIDRLGLAGNPGISALQPFASSSALGAGVKPNPRDLSHSQGIDRSILDVILQQQRQQTAQDAVLDLQLQQLLQGYALRQDPELQSLQLQQMQAQRDQQLLDSLSLASPHLLQQRQLLQLQQIEALKQASLSLPQPHLQAQIQTRPSDPQLQAMYMRSHLQRPQLPGLMMQASESMHAKEEKTAIIPGRFPEKLFDLIECAEKDGMENVISFDEKGEYFRVHDSKRFLREWVPRYFRIQRMSSFKRQLSMYDFRRIAEGEKEGWYIHKHFQKGRPELLSKIERLSSNSSTFASLKDEPEKNIKTDKSD